MKNHIFITSILCLLGSWAQAQTVEDALRSSFYTQGSTARSIGVGGAMGGLGGDFSAVGVNPAGIGAYWKSEIMLGLGVESINTDATLAGNTTNRLRDEFAFGNAALVMAKKSRRANSPWKNFALGIGYNSYQTFDEDIYSSGVTNGSIVERWSALARGVELDFLDNFEAGLAYDAGAILGPNDDGTYSNDYEGSEMEILAHDQTILRDGSYGEMKIAFGSNYNDQLLIGASIGIPVYYYTESNQYFEDDINGAIPFFNLAAYNQNLTSDASGVNFSLGAIFKAEVFRLGASVQTPSWLSFEDRFDTELRYSFTTADQSEDISRFSPVGEFAYNLRTPWRFTGNAAVIVKNIGFISADVEYVDHSTSRYNFTANSNNIEDVNFENELNSLISNTFQGAMNIRAGAEFAKDFWRLRAGYQILGNPYQEGGTSRDILSFGAGYRGDRFFVDLAYRVTNFDRQLEAYQLDDAVVPTTLVDQRRSQVMATFGYKI